MDEKNKERQPTFSFLQEKDGSRATTTLRRVRRIVGSFLLDAHHYHEKNPTVFSLLFLLQFYRWTYRVSQIVSQ